MGDKSSPPPAPDYSGLISAATTASNNEYQLQQQQFQWAQNAYNQNQAQNAPIVAADTQIAQQNAANAAQDRAQYEATTVPMLQAQAAEANQYNNPAFRAQTMGAAGAAVGNAFDAARDNATRDLESYGVDPSSTRFGALDIGVRTQQAAAAAGAENQAGLQVDATGRALQQQSIQNGQITQGQVGGQYNTAIQGGSAAANTGLATTASGASTMGTAPQYAQIGNTALNTAGALQNTSFQNQQTNYQDNFQQSQAYGALAAQGLKTLGGFAFAADGGEIAGGGGEATPGGAIPVGASPSRGQATDDVPARLTAGEFVLPKDVTSWLGEEKLQKLIAKSRQDKQGATARPAIGPAKPQAPTFRSRPAVGGRPQQAGAI
jgi:hypothetical protein